MIDLHTHSLFSDGELLPAELVRRAEVSGYRAIAITDHADISNFDFIIPRIIKACNKINERKDIIAVPGIELTHIDPEDIQSLAAESRKMGAALIVVHGETIAEPVMNGTNRSALASDVDILAHPGIISDNDVKLAAKNGIFLEITSRKGHCLSNGHVVKSAKKYGAGLVLNTDAHAPEDLISINKAQLVARGAGLSDADFRELLNNSKALVNRALQNQGSQSQR